MRVGQFVEDDFVENAVNECQGGAEDSIHFGETNVEPR